MEHLKAGNVVRIIKTTMKNTIIHFIIGSKNGYFCLNHVILAFTDKIFKNV